MCRCSLCGPVMDHEADYSVSFGKFDRELHICKWCKEDLSLFGIRFNQVILTLNVQRKALNWRKRHE